MFRPFTAIAATFGIVAGCTSSSTQIAELPQDAPALSSYTYDAANTCLRPHIERYLRASDQRILFLIDTIGDESKNPLDISSGPLSFGGGLVLTSLMRSSTPNDLVILPQARPRAAQIYFAGGGVSGRDIVGFQKLYKVNRIFGINGGFTANDQNRALEGYGVGGTVRRDNIEARLDYGKRDDGGRINLVLLIGDVATNRTLGSIRLTGTERRNSSTFNGTLEVNGFGVGVSRDDVVIDGIHNVQENLLSAAHFYLWSAIVPGNEEDACLYGPETGPASVNATATAFQDAPAAEKRRLLQRALNEFHGPTGIQILETGVIDQQTITSIRVAEQALNLLPHTAGTYGQLYIQLIERRGERNRRSEVASAPQPAQAAQTQLAAAQSRPIEEAGRRTRLGGTKVSTASTSTAASAVATNASYSDQRQTSVRQPSERTRSWPPQEQDRGGGHGHGGNGMH